MRIERRCLLLISMDAHRFEEAEGRLTAVENHHIPEWGVPE
jgi:hypothetical protein